MNALEKLVAKEMQTTAESNPEQLCLTVESDRWLMNFESQLKEIEYQHCLNWLVH